MSDRPRDDKQGAQNPANPSTQVDKDRLPLQEPAADGFPTRGSANESVDPEADDNEPLYSNLTEDDDYSDNTTYSD